MLPAEVLNFIVRTPMILPLLIIVNISSWLLTANNV